MVSHNGSMGAAEQGCALTSSFPSLVSTTNARCWSRPVCSGTRFHRLSDLSHGRFRNRIHDDFLQFLLHASDTLLFDYDPFHSAVLLQQRCQVVMFS